MILWYYPCAFANEYSFTNIKQWLEVDNLVMVGVMMYKMTSEEVSYRVNEMLLCPEHTRVTKTISPPLTR